MDFNYFLPIQKLDEEKRMVWGYASTPTKDLQGEIVTLDAIKAALPGYMQWANIREMHTASAVGVTKEANVDETGLYIGAKIVDEAAWQKCKEQVYKGFSIGGNKLKKVGDTIKELQLLEISICDRPANPDCRIDVVKVADGAPAVAEEGKGLAKLMDGWMEMGKSIVAMIKGDGMSSGAGKTEVTPADQPGTKPAVVNNETTEKTEFTQDERTDLAHEGKALPDGSFPIRNKEDLEHAIQAIGRAKDPEKAKAHIKARAKDLDAESLLPEKWEGSKGEKTAMTAEEQALAKRYSEAHKASITKGIGHIRKAEELREKCMKALAKCTEMGKAADGDVEKKKEVEKAHEEMDKFLKAMGDAHELAEMHMGKALGGPNGTVLGGGDREGVSLATEEKAGEGTDLYATNSPYSASVIASAIKDAVAAAVKPLEDKLQKSEVDNARLAGQVEVLGRMPANVGTRPRLFGMDKASAMPVGMSGDDEKDAVNAEIRKSFGEIDPNDPDTAIASASRIIGLRAANPQMFGKKLTDPSFKGGAGR